MKKLSVVLYVTTALVLLLGGPSGTSGALAGPLPNKPASANTAVAAAAGTAVLTIPAAAFTPFEDGYDYENHGRYLFIKSGVSGPYGWFSAPVSLPHGATVTKMTFHWYDDDTQGLSRNGIARLQRTRFGQGNFEEMAYAETPNAASGYGSTSDTTISYATIDNSQYAYWVVWDLPVSGSGISVKGCDVVIEYTPPTTVAGRLSIPAAAFTPFEDGYDFQNDGRYLQHFDNPAAITGVRGWYSAPVHLPDGATITKMTFYYRDNTTDDGIARLQRSISNGGYENMASIDTSGGWSPPWYNSKSTTTIYNAVIDNLNHSYWVVWDLPRSLKPPSEQEIVWGCAVVIEYTYRVYLPLVLKGY